MNLRLLTWLFPIKVLQWNSFADILVILLTDKKYEEFEMDLHKTIWIYPYQESSTVFKFVKLIYSNFAILLLRIFIYAWLELHSFDRLFTYTHCNCYQCSSCIALREKGLNTEFFLVRIFLYSRSIVKG